MVKEFEQSEVTFEKIQNDDGTETLRGTIPTNITEQEIIDGYVGCIDKLCAEVKDLKRKVGERDRIIENQNLIINIFNSTHEKENV